MGGTERVCEIEGEERWRMCVGVKRDRNSVLSKGDGRDREYV